MKTEIKNETSEKVVVAAVSATADKCDRRRRSRQTLVSFAHFCGKSHDLSNLLRPPKDAAGKPWSPLAPPKAGKPWSPMAPPKAGKPLCGNSIRFASNDLARFAVSGETAYNGPQSRQTICCRPRDLTRRTWRYAFSLIEVVLSLAILSTGVIVIVGMFASGIQSARKTTNESMAAMIAQDTINDLRVKINDGQAGTIEFGGQPTSTTIPPTPQYFDQRGLTKDETDAYVYNYGTHIFTGNAFFRVDVGVFCNAGDTNCLPPLPTYPGGTNGLERVIVQVSWPVVVVVVMGVPKGYVPCTDSGGFSIIGDPTVAGNVARNRFIYATEIAKPDYP